MIRPKECQALLIFYAGFHLLVVTLVLAVASKVNKVHVCGRSGDDDDVVDDNNDDDDDDRIEAAR